MGRSQQLQTTQTLQQQEHSKSSFELTHQTKALNHFVKFPDLRGVPERSVVGEEANSILESLKTSVLGELLPSERTAKSGMLNIPTKGKSARKKNNSTVSQTEIVSGSTSNVKFPGLEESRRGSTTDKWSDSRQTESVGTKFVRAVFNHSPERGYVDKEKHTIEENATEVFDHISNRILNKVKEEQIN